MKLPDINVKNAAIAGGVGYAGLYGLANMPTGLANGLGTLSQSVGSAMGTVSQTTANVLSNYAPVVNSTIGSVGSAAPFVAPMIAGGWLGNRITKAMNIENKTLKNFSSVVGTTAGALGGAALAATSTTAAPILTITGAGLGTYYGLKYGFKGLGYVAKKVKGGVKGVINA